MSVVVAQRGFTLVELMIALFIVALALPALMFQLGSQLDSAAYMRDKTLANWVAENQVAEIRLAAASGQFLTGSQQGESVLAGRSWRWTMTTEASPLTGVNRVRVDVFDANGDSAGQGALITHTIYTLDQAALVAP